MRKQHAVLRVVQCRARKPGRSCSIPGRRDRHAPSTHARKHARTHTSVPPRKARTGRMHTQQRKQNDTGHNASITHRSGYSASPAAACLAALFWGYTLGYHWVLVPVTNPCAPVKLWTGQFICSTESDERNGSFIRDKTEARQVRAQMWASQYILAALRRTPTVAWLGRPLTVAVQRLHR